MKIDTTWPSNCCVPAFFDGAMGTLGASAQAGVSRADIAKALDVVVAPYDDNPYGLATSIDPSEWGVSPEKAAKRFPSFASLYDQSESIEFKYFGLNQIIFGMFEDFLREADDRGLHVGIGFDYEALWKLEHKKNPFMPRPKNRAFHVCSLTPFTHDHVASTTIRSVDFSFDFLGEITIFDASVAMGQHSLSVEWCNLVNSARSIDGRFWILGQNGKFADRFKYV